MGTVKPDLLGPEAKHLPLGFGMGAPTRDGQWCRTHRAAWRYNQDSRHSVVRTGQDWWVVKDDGDGMADRDHVPDMEVVCGPYPTFEAAQVVLMVACG